MGDKLVQVKASRLKQLQEAEIVRECLEEFGVDNWEGYSDAMREASKRIFGENLDAKKSC